MHAHLAGIKFSDVENINAVVALGLSDLDRPSLGLSDPNQM